ncbi:hypothetical protein [Pantoea vagans]|uniref:hypothetical protein n=1 Tax=Pantoea vagans TaxID=470934 RepID=UPI0023B0D7AB|nr:hypothetical protein [Pantoea vagans]MDE8558966.1 hypothetical protein [Pantoea vagans]MDE8578971.1 hypothetical protein [Pantoea vagans]
MAAMDPIHFHKAINLFPQLSQTQAENCFIFSTSATYHEVSEIRGKSPVSIKKTLEKAQINLELHTVQSIRPVFLTRLLFNAFYLIRTGKKRSLSLKDDMETFLSALNHEQNLFRLFPELGINHALLMCSFCSGEMLKDIYHAFSLNEVQLQNAIDNFLKVMKIKSIQTLRIVVLVRLEAYLASITIS